MLEKYRTTELTLDLATQYVPPGLIAHANDKAGRRLKVTITDGGNVVDLANHQVWLLWRHTSINNAGIRLLDAVDTSTGVFACNLPSSMLHLGEAVCSIAVADTNKDTLVNSLNFTIKIESVVFSESEHDTDDDFTDLQQALVGFRGMTAEGVKQIADQASLWRAQMADQQTVFDDSQAAREQSYLDAETARGASYDAAEANRAESFTANETKRDETSEVAVKRANDAADKVNQAIAGELDPYVRTALDEMKDKPGGIVGYEKYEDERFTPDEVTIITYTDDTGKHIKAALGSSADGTTISETIDPDTNEKTFSVAEPVMSRVEGLETSLTESDKRITTVEDAIAVLKEDMGVIDDSLFRATGVR